MFKNGVIKKIGTNILKKWNHEITNSLHMKANARFSTKLDLSILN